ncbi:hypothetical protein V6N13_010164 [Hibiscus sabdariffa]
MSANLSLLSKWPCNGILGNRIMSKYNPVYAIVSLCGRRDGGVGLETISGVATGVERMASIEISNELPFKYPQLAMGSNWRL